MEGKNVYRKFMKKKPLTILLILLIILILLLIVSAFISDLNRKNKQIINLTSDQKISDFDYLCEALDKGYPFWRDVNVSGINKEIVYSEYRKNIEDTKTDIEFFKEIGYFLKEFGGYGHLTVLDGSMYRLYMDTLIIGNNLLNEQELQTIQPLIQVLTNPISQNTYSLLDQSHTGFRSTAGLKDKYTNIEQNQTLEENQTGISTQILIEGKTAYLKLPSFELTNIESDKIMLENFFAEIKELPNLIIDIRGNSGGSDLYWKQLLVSPNVKEDLKSERYFFFNMNEITQNYVNAIFMSNEIINTSDIGEVGHLSSYYEEFTNLIIESTLFKPSAQPYSGEIFVLVDEKVYSASENFVMFCKNSGFATLVGTQTNGDGGIADPLLISLPESGLIVRFSMFFGVNPDGTGNEATGTTPDVLINKDEDALEKCLSLLN